jgi:hypothetical protein
VIKGFRSKAGRQKGRSEILVLRLILEHMQANAKQILITTESREVFVIRHEVMVQVFCPDCNEQVEMLNFDAATTLYGIGGRELIHRSEGGDIHSIEAATGHLLICRRSLTGLLLNDRHSGGVNYGT